MALSNVTWGEERIAHELLVKLGLRVAPRTVRKYMPGRDDSDRGVPHSSQRWSTFVRNHAKATLAADFLTVVTARFQFLYVFVVMEVGSRRILHVNVTTHPSAEWTLQQFREAIPCVHDYRFVIVDRDTKFSKNLRRSVRAMGRQGVEDAPIRAASEFLLRETARHHPPRVSGLSHPAVGEASASPVVRMA